MGQEWTGTESRILSAYYKYVNSNWHASLGYGEKQDRHTLDTAYDEAQWLMNYLGMNKEQFWNNYKSWRILR